MHNYSPLVEVQEWLEDWQAWQDTLPGDGPKYKTTTQMMFGRTVIGMEHISEDAQDRALAVERSMAGMPDETQYVLMLCARQTPIEAMRRIFELTRVQMEAQRAAALTQLSRLIL